MRRVLVVLVVLAVLLVGGAIYFALDPAQHEFFPRCVFLNLTGYKCPGCGSQRALHALLHGDVVGAFKFNAMLLVAIPWLAVCIYGEAIRTSNPARYARINSPRLIMLLLVAILAWWLLRNIFSL